jgi:hypothetical protein
MSSGGTALEPVAHLVGGLGNGDPDAAAAQVLALGNRLRRLTLKRQSGPNR